MSDKSKWASKCGTGYLPVIVAVLAGITMSIGSFVLAYMVERDENRRAFSQKAARLNLLFQRELEANTEALDGLTAFFESSKDVDRNEFRTYIGHILSRHRDIQAVEWIPRVKHADRPRYESAARKDGFPAFRITELDGTGGLMEARRRPEYFPVFYMEPYKGNEQALGFDLASEPARKAAIDGARDTGKITATGRITLVQEAGSKYGFLLNPVYKKWASVSTVEKRRENLSGFLLIVFRYEDMVQTAFKAFEGEGFTVGLYDITEGEEALLYQRDHMGAAFNAGARYEHQMEVGGRRWLFRIAAPSGLAHPLLPFSFLAGGLMLTALMGAYMTSLKRHAEKMEQSRHELYKERNTAHQYLDIAGVMFLVIDREQKVALVNRKGCEILGYEKDEIIGKNWFDDFLPERLRAEVKTVFIRILNGGTELFERHENPVLAKDGRERIIAWHNTLLKDKYGAIIGTLSSGEDITERKMAEQRLAESEGFVRHVLESVGEGFIVIDRDYKVISANRAFCEGIKTPLDEIIGRHCYEVSHRLDRPCYEAGETCTVKHTFETGEPASCMHTHYDKKGEPVFLEIKSFPMKDESGNVISVIETCNDITERRKLEEQLRQAHKMEAVGTLAGGIAHDFNNILTGIIGYVEMMKMDMKEDDPHMFNLEQVLALSEKAVSLVQGLLAFGRKQMSYPEPIDLNGVVLKMKGFLFRILGEDIELKLKLSETPLTVMADQNQMEQVVMNLCTNSRDAMPNGGTLIISSERLSIDSGFINKHGFGKKGDYSVLTIADTGAGMDKKTVERIFEPFYTTKEVGKGTGLGLSIVYGIIKQHGGYINAYSEPGEGSTFKIYLPTVGLKEAVMERLPELAIRGGEETILVAEDEEYVRKLVRVVLEEFGYKVIEAVDGEDAVEKFIKYKDDVDLLYLDVVMPRLSGREVLKKAFEIKPGIKAILTSGYPSDLISKKDVIEEKVDFIPKPATPRVILTKVREALDK